MPRPGFSFEAFLAHVYSPRKNAKPTGLRKSSLSGLKGGRKRARLNAYNRMDAVKQAVLAKSGKRDAYLRGEVTYTQAKQSLRNDAVERGIVKPLKRKYGQGEDRTEALKRRIADILWRETRPAVPTTYQRSKGLTSSSKETIEENVVRWLDEPEVEMLQWDFGTFQTAAKGYEVNGKRYLVFDGTNERNPFWYH